jgi:hypothetical protein
VFNFGKPIFPTAFTFHECLLLGGKLQSQAFNQSAGVRGGRQRPRSAGAPFTP